MLQALRMLTDLYVFYKYTIIIMLSTQYLKQVKTLVLFLAFLLEAIKGFVFALVPSTMYLGRF